MSAKSVFHFDVQGAVAKSTHSGIPWLRYLRRNLAEKVHFWPFDGWELLPGRSVIVEVYLSPQRLIDSGDKLCGAFTGCGLKPVRQEINWQGAQGFFMRARKG